MNTNFFRQSFFAFFLLLSTCATAQSFEAAMNKLAANYSPEKVYLQYDKDYYIAGETIFFKAYLYNNGKPAATSNNFYLRLTNNKGEIISSQKYPLVGATVNGSIVLSDSLSSGNYYIRAFTPGMLNDDETFHYHKNIFVYGQRGSAPGQSASKAISVGFFPESGHLVDGILTTVAFKATDQWGQPAEVSGIIKTEEGITLAPFKTGHDGMGRVPIKPIAGKKYIAEIETETGKRTYTLPEIQASGINLKLTDEPGGKKFQLSRGNKNKQEYDIVRLVVTENYAVIYENEIAFEDYLTVIGHILTDSLPSGILHFTIFDKENKPLAERLSFVDNGEYRSNGRIEVTKKGIGKREENMLEISFSDSVQRSLSVSIVDYASANTNDAESIWSRLLLTSDLKGHVYNPAWYFEKPTDSTRLAMDNLMLTHGWSRYTWKKILEEQYPQVKYKDETLITIKGLVTDRNNKPVSSGRLNIFLDASDVSSQPYTVNIGADGRFSLDSMLFRGKGEFFYAYTDKQDKPRDAIVAIDKNGMEEEIARFMPANILAAGVKSNGLGLSKEDLLNRTKILRDAADAKVKELENVSVTSSVKKASDAVNEKYTTGVFRSEGKETIDNINDPPSDMSQNGVDFVKNRIQQLMLDGNNFTNRKNFSLASGQRWTVGIFINEQPANLLQLRILRADEIALVKFYEAGFVGASSATPGGALAVYTKDKKVETRKDDKLEMFEYAGYTVVKEFYNPDYSVPEKKLPATDSRTTLLWSPVLFTGSGSNMVPIHFYNNDFSKKLKVVAEGFDVNGKLVHLETIIE